MPIAITNLGVSTGTTEQAPDLRALTDATSYTIPSWNPPDDGIVALCIFNGNGAGDVFIDSVTGNGDFWQPLVDTQYPGTPTRNMEIYVAYGADLTTGETVIDFAGITELNCYVSIFHITEADEDGLAIDAFGLKEVGGGTATSASHNWTGTPRDANSRALYFVAHNANEEITQPGSLTKLDDMNGAGPAVGMITAWEDDGFTDPSGSFTWTTSADFGVIAVEILAADVEDTADKGTLTADFELGTNGATVATSDAGNEDPWDVVNIGGGGETLIYDTSRAATGTKSARFQTTGGGGTAHLQWTTSWGTRRRYSGRANIYRVANPGATITHISHERVGGTGFSWSIAINSTGKVVVQDQAGGTLATSTASIPLNDWFRVEWDIDHETGFIEVRLFTDHTASIPTETIISASGQSIAADTTFVDFGVQALSQDVSYDTIVDGAPLTPRFSLPGRRVPKKLFGPKQLLDEKEIYYTAPVGVRTLLRHAHVSNPSAGEVEFTLAIGDADAVGDRIISGFGIPGDSYKHWFFQEWLSPGETLSGYAGQAGTLVLRLDGYERPAG